MRWFPSLSRRSVKLGRRMAVTSTLVVFALVVCLVTLFILTALNRISDYANRFDEARSMATTAGALRTFQEQLQATLNDYAAWDDAAKNVYSGTGQAWIVSNFGAMTVNSDLFDVAVLMDANGNVLMAYQDGKPATWLPESYFGPSFPDLIETVRAADPGAVPEAAGFVASRDGVAAVGVALVREKSGAIDKVPEERRYLVFARHLDPAKVADLSHTYVIEGLRFFAGTAAESKSPSLQIRNVRGDILGRLTWTSALPGDRAYWQVRPLVYCALAMVGLFFLLLLVSGTNTLDRLKADEASARRLAMQDRLSGLLNRAGFFAALDTLIAENRMHKRDVLLLYLDLDGFKEVNDAYGHGTGDRLIRGVAAGLQMLVADDGVVARVGGDEFALAVTLTDRCPPPEVLCDRILGFFEEPFVLGERVAIVGTSIGVAISPGGRVYGEELVRRADMAMYRAKEMGRRRSEYYVPEMDAAREERNLLEIDLRVAIERREITVAYQPVVEATSHRVIGVEALARWNRRGHGPVPPDIFIPIAESSGLIDQLGLFVLHRACETVRRWPGLKLAVNISPGQFRDPDFAMHVASVLQKTKTDPAQVMLEMTEGYLIQNPERARASIAKLKRLGVKVALDDFGAGFASVGYLRQFGFDRMKIDKSLVRALEDSDRAGEMLQATVALARALDMPVTAEGVETEAQALQLRLTGCDELQGYFFGRPVAVEEIDALYQRPPTFIPSHNPPLAAR